MHKRSFGKRLFIVVLLWLLTWIGVLQMARQHNVEGRAFYEKTKSYYIQNPERYASSGWVKHWSSFPTWDQVKVQPHYVFDDRCYVVFPFVIFVHSVNSASGEDALYLWWGFGSQKFFILKVWR